MKEQKNNNTLLGKHALNRLDQVQEKNRKVYAKRPNKIPITQILMGLVLIAILIIMMIGLKQ